MLIRKAIATYLTSSAVVIYMSLILTGVETHASFPRFDQFMTWTTFISLYVFPIILIYGSLVSMALEFVINRRVHSRTLEIVLPIAGHLLFGALISIPFRSTSFTWLCLSAAFLYWLTDRLFVWMTEKGWRKNGILLSIALPLVIIAGVGLLSLANDKTPKQQPFTKEAAVRAATSGTSGTELELFPKQVGATQLELDGYKVTRETSVARVGDEQFEVTFREHWRKDDEEGSRSMIYTVTRGSMTLKTNEGSVPPYLTDH
ncbi:hypothetical protein D3P07_18475 [Paenibacillus sp. 1011MAR3C5]|uniref:hypothetical protein n=1 Tax=Paenibacillus sp. 1011MAR3C5 TaxID=1675787 RepID=UPI000E6BCB84|nr:hypothetical protein [Paenibacillus sp. 1011MAR3C5]RJE86071.1 hypothetical protein D3P07_18475 [Paenibacillus sp. 1011MAR3C5]